MNDTCNHGNTFKVVKKGKKICLWFLCNAKICKSLRRWMAVHGTLILPEARRKLPFQIGISKLWDRKKRVLYLYHCIQFSRLFFLSCFLSLCIQCLLSNSRSTDHLVSISMIISTWFIPPLSVNPPTTLPLSKVRHLCRPLHKVGPSIPIVQLTAFTHIDSWALLSFSLFPQWWLAVSPTWWLSLVASSCCEILPVTIPSLSSSCTTFCSHLSRPPYCFSWLSNWFLSW